jgi:hypothetical protein
VLKGVVTAISSTDTLTNKTISASNNTLTGVVTPSSTDTLTNKIINASNNTLTGVVNNTLITTTGDMIYASSANTPARLGIGSAGQVLTVSGGIPSWAAAASGGGMTLLSTTTINNSLVAVNFSSTGYNNLFIIGENIRFNSNTFGHLAINGGVTCHFVNLRYLSGNYDVDGAYQGNSSSEIQFAYTLTATGENNNAFAMNIYNVASSTGFKNFDIISNFKRSTDNTYVTQYIAGFAKTTSPITNFGCYASGGGYTLFSGTVKIYGVK